MNYQIATIKNTSAIFRLVGAPVFALAIACSPVFAQQEKSNQSVNPPAASSLQEVQQPALPENLFFTVERASNLTVLARAVKAVGLTDTLKGAGPFTVLAPTDEAFAELGAQRLEELFLPENKEQLKDILLAHILPIKVTAAELAALPETTTLKRNALKVEIGGDGKLRLGKADSPTKTATVVTQPDVAAENGALHFVSTVLLPETVIGTSQDN